MKHRNPKHPSTRYKLIILVLILLIIISSFAAYKYVNLKKEGVHFKKAVYPIRAVMEYSRDLGITGNRSLDYPRIPIGTTVTRDIALNNDYGFRLRIVPSLQGNVTPYVVSSMAPITLEIGEIKKFNVSISGHGQPGNYTGNLTLDLYKLI